MLDKQRRLTSNYLLHHNEAAKFEREQIYVPLALVERTQPDKRERSYSPEMGSKLYEPQYQEKQRFEHEAFLTQVLQRGEGKTKGKQIALIGEPGAGKTTLLQAIAFWVLENNLGYPIWITLTDWKQTGTDFQTYLRQTWLSQAIPEPQLTQAVQNNFTQQIQQGRVWLLLDGVDEIAASGADTLQTIARQLTGWITSARVILTCRLNVWQADSNALEALETYRLLDFDYPQQVHQFIDNWFNSRDAAKGERLKTELDSSDRGRLRDLVQNPLRLALLCSSWQNEEGNLPQTKAALYYQFVQQFYKWKECAFPISREKQRELNKALGELALRDIEESSSRFRLKESFICEELGEPEDKNSLFYKALQLGWLNQVGIAAESDIKEKVYAFFHPTFEEYFAATSVKDWHYFFNHVPGNPSLGTYRVFDRQWREVILLWLGQPDETVASEQKNGLIDALVDFEDECGRYFNSQAFLLASEGVAEFSQCDRADEIVQCAVEWCVDNRNPYWQDSEEFLFDIQNGVPLIIYKAERTKTLNFLRTLLSPEEPDWIRLLAAYWLAYFGTEKSEIIPTLINLLQTNQNLNVIWKTAQLMGMIDCNNVDAVKILYNLSNTSEDPKVIQQVAHSLGKLGSGNECAINALIELINTAEIPIVRWQAIKSLGKVGFGNFNAINTLIELLRTSPDLYISWRTSQSLINVSKGNSYTIRELIKILIKAQDAWIHLAFIEKLLPIKHLDKFYYKNFLSKFKFNSFYYLCTETLTWDLNETFDLHDYDIVNINYDYKPRISDIASPEIEDFKYTHYIAYTCFFTSFILQTIAVDSADLIQFLVSQIKNSKIQWFRLLSASTLTEVITNQPDSIVSIVELLQQSNLDEEIKLEIAKGLENISKSNLDIVQALLKVFQATQNIETRLDIADIILNAVPKDSEVIAALNEILRTNQDDEICLRSVKILLNANPENSDAIAFVIKMLRNSQDKDIVEEAIECSENIAPGNYEAINALIQVLSTSQDEGTCQQAVESLGKIGNNSLEAINALFQVLCTSLDEEMLQKAVESLEKIGKNNLAAIHGIVQLLHRNQDEDTRLQAAVSLWELIPENPVTIKIMIQLLCNSNNQKIFQKAASNLKKILQKNYFDLTVIELKELWLHDETENSELRREALEKVLIQCAENMFYPDFHKAWNNQEYRIEETAPTPKKLLWEEKYQEIINEVVKDNREANYVLDLAKFYGFDEKDKLPMKYYEQALDIAREFRDRRWECYALNRLGNVYLSHKQYERALFYYEQQLSLAGDDYPECKANSLHNEAIVYDSLKQPEKAVNYYQLAIAIARNIHAQKSEINFLNNLGISYHSQGQHQQAVECHEKALEMASKVGERQLETSALTGLCNAYCSLKQFHLAIETCQNVLEIKREVRDQSGEYTVLQTLANLYLRSGKFQEAKTTWNQIGQIPVDVWSVPEWYKRVLKFSQRGKWQLTLFWFLVFVLLLLAPPVLVLLIFGRLIWLLVTRCLSRYMTRV
ncbi:HEAT repeat domain-containing protein [Floridanema aerugineum]|uniref:HEAT repeat domain-containing protein n=1 Tax=Floridaenema aerugineum BLCC-F46 TaxID=3153654 RepID=A0ABV4X1S5_9CYAN